MHVNRQHSKPAKVLHLTVVRQLTSGQKRQLSFEHNASGELTGATWRTIAYHNGEIDEPFVRRIPPLFRGQLGRKLYAWVIALLLCKKCDILLMRHMTFDPFALIFSPIIPNRISVHHAKEAEELILVRNDWRGRLASRIERITGRKAVQNAKIVAGVTKEIAEYERVEHHAACNTTIYPNGICVNEIEVLRDRRENGIINVGFICGKFSSWHGLDKLFSAISDPGLVAEVPRIRFHLVGELTLQQLAEVQSNAALARHFVAYGSLSEPDYRKVLERCDIGLGSLALERKGLKEAATLKVREMLAMGLPVYATHEDVALNHTLGFALVANEFRLLELCQFALAAKQMKREFVRKLAAPLIDKRSLMQNFVNEVASEPKLQIR